MYCSHDPIVGTWFVNVTGQLLKVKLLMFNDDKLHRVLIQYLDGSTRLVDDEEWFCLKLNKQIHEASLSMKLH